MGQETGEVFANTLLWSKRKTLVPERLADDLVASSTCLGDVLGFAGLLDRATGVLDVAAMLVKGRHFHCFFDGRDVDG